MTYRHHRQTLLSLIFVLFAVCGAFAALQMQIRPAWAIDLETKVKVAYIYNFTKFIDWPGDDGAAESEPVNICVIGADPIRTMLGELTNREAKGRPIRIMRIKDVEAPSPCRLLFISRSEEQQLPHILQRVQGTRILTISDIPRFAQRGGMIGFSTERERVKIEINQKATRQAGLKISAKLLEIARIVP